MRPEKHDISTSLKHHLNDVEAAQIAAFFHMLTNGRLRSIPTKTTSALALKSFFITCLLIDDIF